MPEAALGCYCNLMSYAEVLAEPLKYREMCIFREEEEQEEECLFLCNNVVFKKLRLHVLQ